MENKPRLNLGLQILIALVLGIVAGILLQGKGEFTSTFL